MRLYINLSQLSAAKLKMLCTPDQFLACNCRFVASRISILGEAASKSIEALGFVSEASARQLVCLDPVTPTLLCLERMKERGVR